MSLLADRLQAIDAARDSLAAAQRQLETAQQEMREARDGVHAVLDLIASRFPEDGGINHNLIRSLYWPYPEVHALRIGRAAGVQANQVFRYAGNWGEREVRCAGGCGKRSKVGYRNRTNYSNDRSAWMCGPCASEHKRKWAEWMQARDKEREAEERAEDASYDEMVVL